MDFEREYSLDPLNLSWRKFVTLLGGLSGDSRFKQAVFLSNPENLLDKAMGRESVPKRVIDVNEFLAGIE